MNPPFPSGDRPELVWAAILFANVHGVAGASRGSTRLHWTRLQACIEAESWVPGPVSWRHLDGTMSVGHTDCGMTLVVRAILLPLLPMPMRPFDWPK